MIFWWHGIDNLGRMFFMKINLTRSWNKLKRQFTNRRFSRLNYSRLTPAEKKLKLIRWARFLTILALAGTVAAIVLFFITFAWVSRNLPKPGQIVRTEGFNTQLLDRNGNLIHDLYQAEKREPVAIDQMPTYLKQATVAVEDKDFYKHKGFDFLTIIRIPYNYIFKGGRVVGGSTLTQQLVKTVLLTNERTITRKFKELVLSLQIERKFTKDQILEMYLNEVPYGGVSIGVGAASESYFNKKVSELTLAESAILAGLPQRPSAYSPFLGKTDEDGKLLWKLRAEGVLRRMVEDGYITELAREEALAQMDQMTFTRQQTSINAPHFVFYIEDQLDEMFGEDMLKRGGLKVTTTLDLELQKDSQQIVYDELEKIKTYDISNGAALAMNPNTGEILAMVGSKDYSDSSIGGQYNVVVDGLRQPGSSIKPLTYLAMFQKGYSPASMITDVETTFTPNETADKPYQPKNYDGKFHGPVSLRTSLGSSLNIPAVKSLAIVGVDNFLELAYKMGFPTLEPTEENMKRFGLSATLGGAEVHLIDTVTAYSSFANLGTKVEPVSILKVENLSGQTLYEYKPAKGPSVITEAEAFLINHVLADNDARSLAFGPNSLLNMGKGVSVKTGTTNDQRDNWTIGWNKNVIVGTWVGNNDNSPMKHVASGVTGASPIWRNIIKKAIDKGYVSEEWKVPEGVEQVEVDKISGYPSHDGFESRFDYYIKGTKPTTPDPIHSKLKVCRDDQRKLATDAKIGVGDYEEKEFIALREEDPVSQDGKNRWQEGINAWVNVQGDLYKPPTEYCGENSDIAIRISKPENEKNYQETEIEVHIDADSGDGIEKIELWVNGSLKETINNRSYKGKIKLDRGRYKLQAKALSRSGKWANTGEVKIGTGGEDWREPAPSPTPSPTPSPSPTPVATPLPSPSPIIEL